MRFLLFLTLIFPLSSFAQMQPYVSAVAGTYRMNDLKDMHKEMINSSIDNGLPLKATMSFPASVGCEAGADWTKGSLILGGFANYTMTKGSLQYADYSGEQTIDQKLSRYSLGLKIGRYLFSRQFSVYGKTAFTYTALDILSETQLTTGENFNYAFSYRSLGISFEPGIQWSYPWQRFTLFAHGGYQFQFSGKTYYTKDADIHLTNGNQEVHVDWSGIRVGIGIGFSL